MTDLRIILSVFVISLILVGCDKRPGNVLDEDEMVRLIADMEVAEIYFQQYPGGYYNDSIRDRAIQFVLDKHHISKKDFDSTLTWYGKNIDVYQQLYSKVDKELLNRQKKITGKSETDLVSNDLWPFSRHYFIDSKSGRHDINFAIQSSEVESGERLIWRLRTNSMPSGQILLGVEYENGTSSVTYQSTNSKISEITLQTDSSQRVKRIMGQFRLKDSSSLPVWIDSISLKSLPFDSTEYYRIYSQRLYRGPKRRLNIKEKADSIDNEENSIEEKKGDDSSASHHKSVRRLQPAELDIDKNFKPTKLEDKARSPKRPN